MAVVTGPGAGDGLPWDEDHCSDRGPHKHSGPAGCRVVPEAAKRFNRSADKRLSRLHEAAYQRTYRRWGAGALRRLAVVPELHRRGVMHWHLVLGAGSAASLAAAQYYVQQLAELARSYGFGYVDRGKLIQKEGSRTRALRTQPASQVAGYVAKYLTKDGTVSLRELVVTRQAPRRAAHVHRELTMRTRWTMRNQRRRRYVWRVWRVPVTAVEAEQLLALAAVFDGELVEHRPRGDPAGTARAVSQPVPVRAPENRGVHRSPISPSTRVVASSARLDGRSLAGSNERPLCR
jgi:hypothetical protein